MQVTRESHPELFKTLRRAGYRKHSATVNVRATSECTQPYWSGGSREEHYMLNLATGSLAPIHVPGNPWPQPPASKEVETAPGFAIVHGGIFLGKSAHWSIVMHVDDAQKLS